VQFYHFFPIIAPTLEKSHRCQLIIASEPQSSFNPNVLAASLAGLRDLIVDRLYETVLPEIKDDKQDDILAHAEEDLEDCDDDEQGEEESK
jgi:hypothetical protein